MVYKLRETKHKNGYLFVFQECIQVFLVSSSSDSEDGGLTLMYNPILLRSIAKVLLLNHLLSQDLESGDTQKVGRNIALVRVDNKFTGCILQIMQKGWKISSEDWWGVGYLTIY